MSPIEMQENILSETMTEQEGGGSQKLVPVSESIRYRKRAQSAEKKIQDLFQQLEQAKAGAEKMAKQLSDIQVEQKLTRKLAAAGTVDLETAVLIAKARVQEQEDADLDGVIEQLKKEKQYLFVSDPDKVRTTAQRTTGAKDRMQNSQTVLERAAKKAATTGNRTDLQEYLKLRRNFI